MPDPQSLQRRGWTVVEGGVTRGDTSRKQFALIFTGGEFGEGTPHILDALARRDIRASFFPTGDFLRQPGLRPLVLNPAISADDPAPEIPA